MRPGLAVATGSSQQNITSMIYGLDNFLTRHTGDVGDDGSNLINKYIINNEGILANNLHFEGGPQDYTPTQCATTEGQALLILGYYYLYKGTNDPQFLQKAEYYFNAYVEYFYGGVQPPSPPGIYRANWILNGKNPFEVYGPTSGNAPGVDNSESPGFYAQPVTFVNGIGQIPAGYPTFGDQLVKVYKLFDGASYSYESVRAGPASGGTVLPFTYFVATNGAWDASYDAYTITGTDPTAVGSIVLQDRTYNGTANVSYVIHTGTMIPRNTGFDVWPTWRSLTLDDYGNAIDAEQWFTEAAHLLYQETGNEFYNQVYQSAILTCQEAAVIDDVTYYFRQEADVSDPFDYGISYSWSYSPSTPKSTVDIMRTSTGYIQVNKSAETVDSQGTAALEQIAVFNQIGPNTAMSVNMSLDSATARTEFLTLLVDSVDQTEGQQYRYVLKPGVIPTPQDLIIPYASMLSVNQSSGDEIISFDGENFATFGTKAYISSDFATFTIGSTLYNDYVGTATVSDSDSGVAAGFWLLDNTQQNLAPLTYKTVAGSMFISVKDANDVKYWYQLPQATNWTTLNLTWDMFSLAPNQPEGSAPTPTPTTLSQVIFEIPAGAGLASIQTYTWGEVPSYYKPTGVQWSTQWYMHVYDVNAFTWLVGDVTIQNEVTQPLAYTPGVVPFSNQYSPSLRRNEFWRGTPYTGYQHPVNWLNAGLPEYYANAIQFWYDAQQAYKEQIGVLGPFCPCYVWPRYDNLDEGTINTFGFGSDQPYPWAGYEPRAFYSAAHLWAELVRQGQTVDPKLIEICQNWASFLLDFQTNNGGLTPSKFPNNAPPFNDGYSPDPTQDDPDNVGHMTGLFLAGCVEMLNAGDTTGIPQQVIKALLHQLNITYVIGSGDYADMSGSWSSYAGGHYFYGFWAGEIFRGLGLLMEWINKGNLIQ
ncbi:hypothetical protein [Paraburkholderia tropica]|uniref:hypothetical protein n=1 Tax=Paraburkholderia tropica TaxID=92647 RepID=UPI002AB2B78E|nr:hypothetical protein [Paraburkholderia tropica]